MSETDELISELRTVIRAGRKFLLNLSDSGDDCNPETGVEFMDVRNFRATLDKASDVIRKKYYQLG